MTEIETATLADGFLLGLVVADVDRAAGALAVSAILMDGGRPARTFERTASISDARVRADLRLFLAPLCAPPNVLAHAGRGAPALLAETLCEHIPTCRLLDLAAAAVAFRPALPSRVPPERLARAYGLPCPDSSGGPALMTPFWSDLLWAVLSEAGRRDLDWPGLLGAAGAARPAIPFERYEFDADALHAAPEAPGVYLMRETGGAVLYVGKAAHLRRRLGEYFRRERALPPKLAAIRERIRGIDWRVVGSELEALLLEARLIRELKPEINVQLQVAEGGSRYAVPFAPVVLLCPSVKHAAVELFFVANGKPALQLRLTPARPAREPLPRVLAFVLGDAPRPRPSRALIDWGGEGAEIARRFFARSRGRLAWLELQGDGRDAERILAAARQFASHPAEAAVWVG